MFKKLLSILVLACAAVAVHAQVAVSVDASSTVRTVDERVFGVNSTMWDPSLGSAQTAQLVQQAGIRFIRLPGGSDSDTTHWYSNQNVYPSTFKWVSGFDAASGLIRSITPQAQAIVTVNYGSGSPEEAAAWVAYANFAANVAPAQDVTIGTGTDPLNVDYNFQTAGYWANLRAASPMAPDDGMNFLRLGLTQPMNFKYWEIGNEVYGQSWEYDTHTPKNEPYTYATNAAAFITKMKAVDPTIKIGVVAEIGQDTYSNGTTHTATNLTDNSVHNGWTPVMLARLKALGVAPDFLIYHRYEQAPGSESDATLLQAASTWKNDAADLRKQLTDYYGTGSSNIELVVTENNSVYSNPGKQSTSLVDGLYLADSIGNVMQTEFNGLAWWALRNGGDSSKNNLSTSLYGWRNFGDYGMLSAATTCTNLANCDPTAYDTYPTYYAMKLMSLFARGGDTVISTSSNNSLLAVYATKRSADNSMSLLVINKSPAAATSAQFAVSGYTPGSTANVYTYDKDNDNAANPLIASGCTDITASTLDIPSATFTASFAPYSMTVLTFNRQIPDSAAATLTSSMPSVGFQPGNKTVESGATASFTSGALGCPAPTYKWQRMAKGSSSWADLSDGGAYSGTTTATLSVTTTASMSGDQFRLVATNTNGNINSNAATLTVNVSSSSSSAAGGGAGGGGGGGGSLNWTLLALLTGLGLLSGHIRLHRAKAFM